MSIHTESISHVQDHHSPARRQYVRPALPVDCPPTPQHWDRTSRDGDLDVSEEDGYVLSANGEGSISGAFVPCDPLSAIRRARLGRLRVKPLVLHRRRVLGITTSAISPNSTVSAYLFSSHPHLPTNHSSLTINLRSALLPRLPHP